MAHALRNRMARALLLKLQKEVKREIRRWGSEKRFVKSEGQAAV